MQPEVYISLGSNIGDRAGNCLKAIEMLGEMEETEILSQSSLYETAPVGYEDQAPFINMAVKIRTAMSAAELLSRLKTIERSMGRVKTFKWGPRLIDMDILFYGNEIISEHGLKVPHPAMADRAFVLLPLAEIGSDFMHPLKKISVARMVEVLSCKEGVRRIVISDEK